MIIHEIIPKREARKPLAAAYVRVSTQKEGQDGSFEEQQKYYERRIRSKPEWEFAGVYAEKASGTNRDDRPVFEQMVQDALDNRIDIILCKSLSRWARNTEDALTTIQMLSSRKVRLIFEEDHIDTAEHGYLIRMVVGAAVAQQESRSISENIKWTYRKRAEKGIYIAQKGKYFGYNTDDGGFKSDENAKYVKAIFDSFADGETMTDIAKRLNDLGIRTTAGRQWTRKSVYEILGNEVYVGDVRFQKKISRDVITGKPDKDQIKKYVKDHHEGIVERQVWDIVQEKLSRQSAKFGRRSEGEYAVQDEAVYNLVMQGMSNQKIADQLNITIGEEKGSIRRLRKQGKL